MYSDTVKHKLNVFISSKCGGKYTIMRKALERLLYETGLIEVYCFENETASSVQMPDAYLNNIDTCQLFILIVDNFDGISPPVLEEFQRAKALQKRIIAIFCNEDLKEKTEVEKEIEINQICKYYNVSSFSDIAVQAYKSVVRDLVEVYKINKKQYVEGFEELNPSSSALSSKTSSVTIKKDIFSGFDNARKHISKIVFHGKNPISYTSKLDELSCKFLEVVLCNSRIEHDLFSSLKLLLLKKHSNKTIRNIVEQRLDAVYYYFSGNLNACIGKIKEASDIIHLNSSVPKWIVNDIGIDLRNMQGVQSNMKGEFQLESEGQKLINESGEFLYYPAIDRLSSDIKENIIKEYNNLLLQSPYTTNFGGYDFIFRDVAMYYCTALLYGSITHLILMKELLIEILQVLGQEYGDVDINKELIKFLVLQSNDKLLENQVRTYNHSSDIISSADINQILNLIENLPLEYERTKAKLILLKHFGNYFSDDQFTNMTQWFADYLRFSMKKNPKIFLSYNDVIKKIFYNNCYRFPEEILFDYIIWLFSMKNEVARMTACELIRCLPFDRIKKSRQLELRKYLRKEIYCGNKMICIQSAIITFCINATVDITPLESAIKKKMPLFFENDYCIEKSIGNKRDSWDQIIKQIDNIKNRINTQSKEHYVEYSESPFYIINYILSEGKIVLEESEQLKIFDAIKKFLFSPYQSAREKINAIKLATNVFISSQNHELLKKQITQIFMNTDKVLKTNDFPFEKIGVQSVSFTFNILLFLSGVIDVNQIIPHIINVHTMEDRDIIACLSFLADLGDCIKYDSISPEIVTILFQLCVVLQNHREKDIRYLATKCLIPLIHSRYQQVVLRQLSSCMDTATSDVKIAIVKNVSELSSDSSVKDFILQKALVDNNYIIREIAKKTVANG